MRLSRRRGARAPVAFSAVSLAVSLVFVGSFAFAQKKGKAEKKEDAGPSAAATWTDPVETEKSDKPERKDDGSDVEKAPEPKRKADDKGRTRDKLDLFAQIIIGFGKAPDNNPKYEPGDQGTALGFQVGGRYDVSPTFSAGLRVPITTASVKQVSNGKSTSTTAFGAPELFGEYRLVMNRLTSIPIGFGVGIPVAEGTSDRTDDDVTAVAKGYVNSLADATSGWRDSELFQPKYLPIVVSGGVRHERSDFELHAEAKFVLMPALSTEVSDPIEVDPPDSGSYKLNAFALREVTTIGGTYNFLDKPLIYAGLDFALIWTPIETFEFESSQDVTAPSSVQAVLEPKVGARFGKVAPSVGYIAPLGGRLGSGDIGGVRLRVDVLL
jgi:hypothetical protein